MWFRSCMRFSAKLLVAACMISLLVCWVYEAADSFGMSLFPDIRARDDAVTAELRQHNALASKVEWIVAELAASRLSLREASRLMEDAAAEQYPAFLTYAESLRRETYAQSWPRTWCTNLRSTRGPKAPLALLKFSASIRNWKPNRRTAIIDQD